MSHFIPFESDSEKRAMKAEHPSAHLLHFVSTTEEALLQVDIINGLSGYEFSRLRLACPLGSAVLWTNRTAITQVVQVNDRVIRLPPGRNSAATFITRWSECGQIIGRLRSNPAAAVTISVTEGF